MELRTYLEILWRRKWVIFITAVVTTLVAGGGAFLMTPTYEATTTLRVAPSGGLTVDYTAITYATQFKNTLIRLAASDRVLDELAQRLGLVEPPDVELELLGNSELVSLTVQHPNRRVAQQAANTMAGILIELNRELYVEYLVTIQEGLDAQLAETAGELDEAWEDYQETIAEFPDDPSRVQAAGRAWELAEEQYNSVVEQRDEARIQAILRENALSVFDPADLPGEPAGLPKVMYVALGAMVGLVAGVGLAFLFENLDTTLHTPEQIETVTELSTLGKIPSAGETPPMIFSNGRSPYEETYRRLRTNLFALGASAPLRTMLIVSAEPEEGKTTIAANLAYTIAESGRQVVIVDCDLRLGRLHRIFEMPNREGLTSILQAEGPALDGLLHKTGFENLWALTSGPLPEKPIELLDSPAMIDLLEHLQHRFDVVLLDAPPISAVADAAVLAPLVDGVLLVVSCGQSREEEVQAAREQLASVGARPVGVVVNHARQNGGYYYYQTQRRRAGIATTLRHRIARARRRIRTQRQAKRTLGTTQELVAQDSEVRE
jgi:succinoglycan biosynthesis transport protein ExoP